MTFPVTDSWKAEPLTLCVGLKDVFPGRRHGSPRDLPGWQEEAVTNVELRADVQDSGFSGSSKCRLCTQSTLELVRNAEAASVGLGETFLLGDAVSLSMSRPGVWSWWTQRE